MSELKRICIIAEHYPYESEPLFTFVQQLAYSLSNEGVSVSVVAPQSLTRAIFRKKTVMPKKVTDKSPEGHSITVFRPYVITFSNTNMRILNHLSNWLYVRAIKHGIQWSKPVDCCYTYFWHMGLNTATAILKDQLPLFVQASECELTVEPFMMKEKYIQKVSGVICASGKNREESIEAGLTTLEQTKIVANGYRKDEFYQQNQAKARRKLGIPEDIFIVAFVGGFISRKGVPQLCKVLNRFEDVYSIFIGRGEIEPNCRNILFKGKLEHKQIATYLACADIFVLPTEAEGCCNAIIEALACGLPVISSNKSFNDEILDESCSIQIDEQNEDELYAAIVRLKNDCNYRQKKAKGALEKASTLTIEKRAQSIKLYIEQRI